ncbi:MAG: ribonuclease E/G, partial [Sphingomonadales bacterium]
MAIRMLIDASHGEETRVAVVKGTRVEEFDFEAAAKKQLKGNIYLAKVTRVEPSLQAAFVDYGGNRHGFLAFGEIHPDYYQIPVADREALIAEEISAQAELDASDEAAMSDSDDSNDGDDDAEAVESVETVDHEDIHEELPRRPKNLKRRYKIQEVIRRRQVLLVQVVKEERGTKGAALTTYLSLAGRYSVLMPNTHHGGGVSRKIGSQADRRRLKSIMSSLDMTEGMGCIIRTAGLARNKAEIKRDFDYLVRTWDEIRDLTLKSIAPTLIYEEGDLIKRAIRDLYNRDIEEVLVEGDEGYKSAKTFMKLLMPSHARRVQPYKDSIPLFHRYQVEGQLDSMFNPTVQLRSGGYIVINPTEALVSIDVNSGKSTREHNIEETALRTNLEASDEVARQLRLRDMAGLVVIDFIDMEDRGNNRQVERRLKEALKSDRARIQVGRISAFGLLEMSRQRLRPGVLEASTLPCPQCEGTGFVRSTESASLHVLRAIEEEGIRGRAARISIHMSTAVALYLLNEKRAPIAEIERECHVVVRIEAEEDLKTGEFKIEGRAEGNVIQARPMQPIDLRKLKPL